MAVEIGSRVWTLWSELDVATGLSIHIFILNDSPCNLVSKNDCEFVIRSWSGEAAYAVGGFDR